MKQASICQKSAHT